MELYLLATCISCPQACRVLRACETQSPIARRLSWPGIPSVNPHRASSYPARSRGAADRLLERKNACDGETKRASASVSTHPSPREPLTGRRRPRGHIAHRQPISVCDQHIVVGTLPASPAHSLSVCLLWASSTTTLALASIVPPLRGRRKEGWPCLTVRCVSLQRGHETLARARGLERDRPTDRQTSVRTPRLNAACRQTCSALRYRASDEPGTTRPSMKLSPLASARNVAVSGRDQSD